MCRRNGKYFKGDSLTSSSEIEQLFTNISSTTFNSDCIIYKYLESAATLYKEISNMVSRNTPIAEG